MVILFILDHLKLNFGFLLKRSFRLKNEEEKTKKATAVLVFQKR